VYCFFFKKADQTVAKTLRHQISQEVEIPEDTLCEDYSQSNENTWLFELDKHEKMSAFILCFFKQVVNYAMIRFH